MTRVGNSCIGGLLLIVLATTPAGADWTLGGFLGGSHTQAASVTLVQPLDGTNVRLEPVHYRAESWTPPFYYGYRVGVFPGSRWIGLEGELIHLKVIAETDRLTGMNGRLRGVEVAGERPVETAFERFSITHGVNLLLLNGVVRRAAGTDSASGARWIFTGRFGAGGSLPHPESTIEGESLERYEWGAFSAQAAGGIERRVTPNISLMVEYKISHTVQEVSVVNGTARTPLTTHHVALGVVAHLGAPRQPTPTPVASLPLR
jgi:opacity protein-like surface antigen